MHTRWNAAWKAALVFVTCLFASYVTVSHRGGLFGVEGTRSLMAQTRRPATRAPDPNFDLTRMQVLRYVMLEINNNYVDPARVHPRDMLLKGLDAIQRSVAQVLVRHDDRASTVTVRVDTHEQTFTIGDVRAPWDLEPRWREIFAFLQTHLRGSGVDLRDVEYAAANGMLHTLDPHSIVLTPEQYHEMQIQTGGHFGGLGIVISIRDRQLTVMNPMPDTPASRAGLLRNDRIVKIGDESTDNMSLSEAVNRLRGPEGTPVSAWIVRPGRGGWTVPRRFELTRAQINVRSVESRMLTNGVGYAKIKSFSETTGEELTRALQAMRAQGMRSLLLDMRGNPGGLLEEAVNVGDLFLQEGAIVVTAGNRREGRDQRDAQAEGTEPNYPIAVLIDGGSASASEIVAGALKNHGRALIVGGTSFGKGSVQTIRNLPDGGALKITIAQYLTPGDVSIQGVGITPDIELAPMTADRLDMDLDADRIFPREADLSAHLTNNRARSDGRAAETVQFNFPAEEREQLRLRGADDLADDGFREDFPVRFTRDLLASSARAGRREMLSDARPLIERTRAEQVGAVAQALRPLGVDWDAGTDGGASNLEVTMTTNRPQNAAAPGQSFDLTVTVTNRGNAPVYRLRATTKSDNPLFENRELVFGRVNPGETRTWTTALGICEYEGYRPGTTSLPAPGTRKLCLMPKASLSRTDGVRLEWSESHGRVPTEVPPLRASVTGLERPVFAYGWQFAESPRSGNGDGRVQAGEAVTMYLTVKNVGRGQSFSTQATIRNLSGAAVLLHDARFAIDNMAPGEERRVAFTFDVAATFRESDARIELALEDEDLREVESQKITVPIAREQSPVSAATGALAFAAETELRESPLTNARVVLRAAAGASFPITAQSGDFVRLDVGSGRPAWVLRAPSAAARGAVPQRPLTYVLHNSPPMIESDGAMTLAVRGNALTLRGRVSDEARVLDMYIYVGSDKVFYQSNRDAADRQHLAFEAALPLRPGANVVAVVAREDDDVVARRVYVVRRDGPNGELLVTPRHGEDDDE
jgi:carboxyl-terminal processing protease